MRIDELVYVALYKMFDANDPERVFSEISDDEVEIHVMLIKGSSDPEDFYKFKVDASCGEYHEIISISELIGERYSYAELLKGEVDIIKELADYITEGYYKSSRQ